MTSPAHMYENAYRRHHARPLPEVRQEAERLARGAFKWADEARERFLEGRPWDGLRVLEAGGGMGGLSLLLARLGAKVTLADASVGAVELGRALARETGLSVETRQMDLTRPDAVFDGPFDMVIDSHLLHCLPTVPERASYFALVRQHLAPGGILVGETMVHRKKIFLPPGWRLDEDKVLWQKFADWVPVRRIPDSLDLEDEFKRAGFHIRFFTYYANYGIAPGEDFWDLPADILPAAVRFVLSPA